MLKVVSSSSSSRRRSEDRFIPLKNVSVQVNIHSFAAEVCIKQTFTNNEETSNSIEAVYCFPIEEQAAIYSFQATLDNGRKIQAEIKEKKKAQKEYCQAIQQKHGAYLLEQDEKSNDIFTISVGALQPQSTCEIEIHYVQELDLINDGQRIQFILPTVIAPRYSSVSEGHGHITSPASTTSKYVQSAPYTISFSCSISSLPIACVGSPSHPIQITPPSENSPSTEVSLVQENTHLDRDVILNIDLKQQRLLTYTLVEKQAMMISLVPTVELCQTDNQIGKINCEYIFIVDCSGSMSDENKIGYARQAMGIFLKSLPIGSFFNIIRFGSTYEQFKNDQITIEYNEKHAEEAKNYIENMDADLGGTELYSVLSYLHDTPPKLNYSRQIFLLTDGEISDVDKVLRLCHSISNTTRIYSFGLGSSPSRALVKGLARVTNGSFLFIPPKTHVDVAVARQITKALEPCLVNMKIQCHFNNPELQDYRISPKILPPIHANQRLNVYIMMPKIIEGKLTGSIDFLTDKDQLLERITLNETEPSTTLLATRLAAKSIISDLQMDDYNSTSSRQARFVEQEEKDKKQQLIDISIEHQILSPFTAFIGIEKRTEQEKVSAGEMILREVPIEIRTNDNSMDYDRSSSPYMCMRNNLYTVDCDEEDDEEEECDEDETEETFSCSMKVPSRRSFNTNNSLAKRSAPSSTLKRKSVQNNLKFSRKKYVPRSRSRSRSRSPLQFQFLNSHMCPQRFPSMDREENHHETTNNLSDTLRQIISLQNFNGLWSINNLEQIISLFQQNSSTKTIDIKNITNVLKEKDQDVVLSMIIMFSLTKYFLDDELLWKPIIKKCKSTLNNQLAQDEYDAISNEIRLFI